MLPVFSFGARCSAENRLPLHSLKHMVTFDSFTYVSGRPSGVINPKELSVNQGHNHSAPQHLLAWATSRHLGKFMCRAVLVTGLAFGLAQQAKAQSDGVTMTPTTLAGGKVISSDEARKLVEQKGAMVIDTRSPVNFGKSHVPGAVSIAYKESSDKTANFDATVDQFDLSKLPADKNAAIVIYSDGPAGWKSYKGAVLAVKGGYKNVMYMRGGWAEWTAKGFPAAN